MDRETDAQQRAHDADPVILLDAAPTESLWQTASRDFASARGLRVILVLGLLLWMAFQWGPGNDIFLPSIVASVFDGVDDGSTWPNGVLTVLLSTLAGFGFWAATQLIDAIVVLSGLRLIPALTARLSAFLRRKGWVTPFDEMKLSTRWIIAYASGASVLCLVDVFATGRQGPEGRRHMIIQSVLLSAGSVGAVVAMVTTAAMVATRVPATESGAETFIRFAKNPLTWIVIFAAVYLVGFLKDRLTSDA